MKLLKILTLSTALIGMSACSAFDSQTNTETNTKTANIEKDNKFLTSVQLWGVRKDLKKDFKGTLEKLADMGFDGVEFAKEFGPYKKDPQGLKDYLDSIGLKASGAHLGFKPFRNEFFKTVAFYKTLGVDTIIIPMDKRSFDPLQFAEFTAELNDLAKRLAKYGLKTGYHNHWQEFEPYKNATYWDHIGNDTTENVVMQLDIGWVTYSEKDSVDFIEKFPGRTFTTHLKPKFAKSYEDKAEANGHYAIIGRDNFDWKSVLQAQKSVGGTKWFVVEQEEYPLGMTPLEAVEASKKGFDEIMATLN